MSVYRDIKTSRRLILIGVLFGYVVAAIIAVANLRSDDGTVLTALAFLAVFSLPSTLALSSLDRRPSLLTLASMSAVVQGVILLTSGGLLLFVSAIVWHGAAVRRPRPAMDPRGATWVRPLLAVASVIPLLAMTSHLDPMCIVVSDDGEVIREYQDPEAPSGWSLQLGGMTSSSTSSDGETTTSCLANTIVVWEPILSMALSVAFVILVWSRWPTAQDLATVDAPVVSTGDMRS